MQELPDFSATTVLVVGDIMLDRYWWGDVDRISPEAPVPVVRLRKQTLAAGGAANVAANVAGLGARAILIGGVGADGEADLVREKLEEAKVSPAHLITVNSRPTTVKTRILAHNQQMVRVDQEDDSDLCEADERVLIAAVDALLPQAGAVVISDYAKGLLTSSAIANIIRSASTAGKRVLVDPKGKDYGKYAGAWMITPNRREAAEACNLPESAAGMVETAGTTLLGRFGFDSVLITQGESGMTLFQGAAAPRHFSTAARSVYDVTGAGDTVIGVLATAVAAGTDIGTAIDLANLSAGIVVEQLGTTAIRLDDLRTAIDSKEPARENWISQTS